MRKGVVAAPLTCNPPCAAYDPSRPAAKRGLAIIDGLAAVIERRVSASDVTPNIAIYLKIDAAAYTKSAVLATPPAKDVVGYYDDAKAIGGSSPPSPPGMA